jgi:uncharacterized protein
LYNMESQYELKGSKISQLELKVNTPLGILISSVISFIALGIAEIISHYINPLGGITVYFAILFGLIFLIYITPDVTYKNFWVALGLVPLVKIISMAMPVMLEISMIIWYVAVSIPILIGIIAVTRHLKYSVGEIGLTLNKLPFQFLIMLTGIGLAYIDYLILKPVAWTNELTLESILFPAIIILIFTGLVEEFIYRGILQKTTEFLGIYGWLFIAAIYAILQISQGSTLHCAFVFMVGLGFSWIVNKTGSIVGIGLCHGLLNVCLFLVWPHILG